MKPRNYVKKLNEFISGNKRLNCCGKRVKQDGGDISLVRRVFTKAYYTFIKDSFFNFLKIISYNTFTKDSFFNFLKIISYNTFTKDSFFNFILFSFLSTSAAFAKPKIFLRETLKREERVEIRFISVGKPLKILKSQHILKKSSLIDKLSIVLLPQSDYTRNYEFSFPNFAAVVFASFINSCLIINQVFPFARRCSSGNKFLENGKLLSFAKFTCKHSSASYKYRRDHLGEDRMKRSCLKSDSSVKHILIPREDSRLRHLMQFMKGSDYTFLYFINIFVQ